MMTLSFEPSPISTNGNSSAPMWTAPGMSIMVMMMPFAVLETIAVLETRPSGGRSAQK